ncbi:ammonia-dependent NAD(+) synthetase [Rhizobium sp. CG4]|jgi:NAD+ synthase|uniref:ammonia-dependent NAD(+) synthetase n=1 Tax=Rhizobium sp. CG4 TaxID=2726075 RepID=UPI0020334385|nr:ammonia-dependent NAD(+) synthetase [Rhizobium sp. CG4]MCM2457582.1 ammonia-dependent NAD(+) synthetase [Rhizobium sp. CG4]
MTDDQKNIICALGVTDTFDASDEVARRTAFLTDYVKSSGARALVLGISGGVDSLTAGLLSQLAAQTLRSIGHEARFIAVRLPYGRQVDEEDAQKCLSIIQPDEAVTVNIQPAADAMLSEVRRDADKLVSGPRLHFHLGNIKARQRMIAQYALAAGANGLVVGTDHAAEALMGFFTKFGDGAADILPLAGLNKRRVRAIARCLGAPDDLIYKIPTADLETDAPLKPDEEVYGVSYDEIDDFLEGKQIRPEAVQKILTAYRRSGHKRALAVAPN